MFGLCLGPAGFLIWAVSWARWAFDLGGVSDPLDFGLDCLSDPFDFCSGGVSGPLEFSFWVASQIRWISRLSGGSEGPRRRESEGSETQPERNVQRIRDTAQTKTSGYERQPQRTI